MQNLTKPDQTLPNLTKPDQTNLDKTKQNPNKTKPGQTRPNLTKPSQTKPNHVRNGPKSYQTKSKSFYIVFQSFFGPSNLTKPNQTMF